MKVSLDLLIQSVALIVWLSEVPTVESKQNSQVFTLLWGAGRRNHMASLG